MGVAVVVWKTPHCVHCDRPVPNRERGPGRLRGLYCRCPRPLLPQQERRLVAADRTRRA